MQRHLGPRRHEAEAKIVPGEHVAGRLLEVELEKCCSFCVPLLSQEIDRLALQLEQQLKLIR